MSDHVIINYACQHFLYQNIKCRKRLLNFWCRWEAFLLIKPANEASRKSFKATWKFIILSWIDRIDEHETCWIMNEFSHGNFSYSSTSCSSMNIFLWSFTSKLIFREDVREIDDWWLFLHKLSLLKWSEHISNSNAKKCTQSIYEWIHDIAWYMCNHKVRHQRLLRSTRSWKLMTSHNRWHTTEEPVR